MDAQKQVIIPKTYTAWQIIKTYWQSSERVGAYAFSALILVLTLTLVGFDVVFNYWYNYFYNALQAYNKHEAIQLIAVFIFLAIFWIIVQVYRYYITQLFALRWRNWLTQQFINRWLQKRGYYYLENFDQRTDNPDQRIQEDIGSLVTTTISLVVGLVSAIATFPAFLYILWTLSGVLVIPLGAWGVLRIPGYLVWVSLIYNLIGTLLTFYIGKPLVDLNFEQQRREATFRYSAIDLRSHAEDVALYEGETHQKFILLRLFDRVLDNWREIILRQKKLLWFTGSFNQTAVMLPLLVVLPNYFSKVFLLGGLMQSLRAFGSVQESLAYLINAFNTIAEWRAINQRLSTFMNHLYEAEENAAAANRLLVSKESSSQDITVKELNLSTPQLEPLLQKISAQFKAGSSYLIKGPSGLGKSTFIRALAGIWPFSSGIIHLPQNKKILFLPQKPYMPIGTLEEAILFPDKSNPALVTQIKTILKDCRLEHLIVRLQETAAWSEQLSPGELQRIGFARVFLHQPDWVILDESTSMLDVANEENLYQLLRAKLPHCSVISVGHRPTLSAYHDEIIDMQDYAANSSFNAKGA